MQITLKTTDKRDYFVDVDGLDTSVGDLRQKASEALQMQSSALTLILTGAVLKDDSKTLAEIGFKEGGLIVVMLKKTKTEVREVVVVSDASYMDPTNTRFADSLTSPPTENPAVTLSGICHATLHAFHILKKIIASKAGVPHRTTH